MRPQILLLGLGLVALLCLAEDGEASFPRWVSYQAVLTDSNSVPITQNGLSVRYLIYEDSSGGSFIWAEVTQVDIVDGRLQHFLGSLVPFPDTFFTAFDTLWLELLVDGQAVEPRTKLVASPYSFRVETIDKSSGGTVTGDIIVNNSAANKAITLLTNGSGNSSQIQLFGTSGALPKLDLRAHEIAGTGAEITLRKDDGDRTIEIDAEEGGSGVINLYHRRSGGGEAKTVEIKATADGVTGGRQQMFSTGGGKTIELNAEYVPNGLARIGINEDPDSSTLRVHSDQHYGGLFTNSSSGPFPVALQGVYTGPSTAATTGVWGESWISDGDGTGGFFRGGEEGVRAFAEGGTASHNVTAVECFSFGDPGGGDRYGVYAVAQGGDVTRAVYGFASQGNVNWAGYFAGVTYASTMAIGTGFNVNTGTQFQPPAGYKLAVDGKVICEEVEVSISDDWPDYVFADDYALTSLEELEQEIKQYGHLPGIPSSNEVAEKGIALGNMQGKLLEKIEELTLYVIALNKDLNTLRKENESLKQQMSTPVEGRQ